MRFFLSVMPTSVPQNKMKAEAKSLAQRRKEEKQEAKQEKRKA
jgi:hypothetical protein